jgi:hypothetical protein
MRRSGAYRAARTGFSNRNRRAARLRVTLDGEFSRKDAKIAKMNLISSQTPD